MSNLSTEERAKLPAKDFGDPKGRKYPIVDQEDVDSAAKLVGKAENPDSVKRRIIAIAKRKDLTIPEAWQTETAKMSADLSADDIRARLQDAIEDEYYGGEDAEEPAPELERMAASYIYIVDIFPMSNTFVYRGTENDMFKRGYHLSDTGEVTLLGSPVEVSKVTEYVPVATFSTGEFLKDGDDYVYEGEIFRAGRYPDKNVFADPEDCARVASLVTETLPIKLQHSGLFKDSLKGYGVEKVESRDGGAWLWGRVRAPGWLKDAAGDENPCSVGMDYDSKGKPVRLTELSWVDEGRVPTAKLVAAFSAHFAGKRNSQTDQSLIQAMHDHTVSLGATCSGEKSGGGGKSGSSFAGNNKMANPSFLDKLKAFDPEVLRAGGIEPEDLTPENLATFASAVQPPVTTNQADPALVARIAELENDRAIQQDINLDMKAAVFAKDVIYTQKKASPSEFDELKGLYVMAAKADGKDGRAQFSATGDIAGGANLELLTKSIEKRPALPLFATQIENERPAEFGGGNPEAEQKSVDTLTSATALGQKAAELRAAREKK